MESKHTQGPWMEYNQVGNRTLKTWGVASVSDDAGLICKMETGLSPEKEHANAKLIAAAPDLLAAIQEAETCLRWAAQEAQGKVKAKIVGGWLHHADKAKNAIAKATT